jgi:NAD(P)-dependent dehydrogenase (short-subunit alcohol dehydrogenase family)
MEIERAVVTGGASGLGEVIARRLWDRGAHVVIVDRDQVAGSIVVDEQVAAERRATLFVADLSDEAAVRRVFERVAAVGPGPLSLLVNNAGGWIDGPQFPEGDDWHRSLDLNLRMPMLATQLALPLLATGGAVVNVASSGGWDSGPYGSPEYGAAKAGLIRFTTAVADFDERYGVRVGCVVPHWIGLPRAVAELQAMGPAARVASGGLVEPDVVADAVLALADDPSSAGRVVIVRPGHPPYAIDPAASDPRR